MGDPNGPAEPSRNGRVEIQPQDPVEVIQGGLGLLPQADGLRLVLEALFGLVKIENGAFLGPAHLGRVGLPAGFGGHFDRPGEVLIELGGPAVLHVDRGGNGHDDHRDDHC